MKKLSGLIAALLILSLLTSCKAIAPMPENEISEYVISDIDTENLTEFESEDTQTDITESDTELETSESSSETSASIAETTETSSETTEVTTSQTTTVTTTEATTTTVTTTTESTTSPPVVTNPVNYTPLNYDAQKGVWFAYLDLNGRLKGQTKSQFESYLRTAFQNVKNLGCNTVYVHVRAFGDAYYDSDYYPWTNFACGAGSNPGYDPLEVMIDVAHSYGLSFHAWVNPMRLMTEDNLKNVSDSYLIKQWYSSSSKNGTYIVKPSNSNYFWLNPAYLEVRELIDNGIREIVQNYKVDGIHIDDYFYPTTDSSFDKSAYSASGESDLSRWRMSNIDKLVSGIYSTIKWTNSKVIFGVSPQGNINNNYTQMYADVKKWCSSTGFLDYIVPQIYFGFTNKYEPFETCVNKWSDIVTSDSVQLIIGVACYKIGTSSDDWSESKVIYRQIELCKSISNCNGVALYRYDSLFTGVSSFVQTEVGYIRDSLT